VAPEARFVEPFEADVAVKNRLGGSFYLLSFLRTAWALALVVFVGCISFGVGHAHANNWFERSQWCAPIVPGTLLEVGQDQSFDATGPWWKASSQNDTTLLNTLDNACHWKADLFQRIEKFLGCSSSQNIKKIEWKGNKLTAYDDLNRRVWQRQASRGVLVDPSRVTLYIRGGKEEVMVAPWRMSK
jgi:hypothetical protein